jgi:hypothetical protein
VLAAEFVVADVLPAAPWTTSVETELDEYAVHIAFSKD